MKTFTFRTSMAGSTALAGLALVMVQPAWAQTAPTDAVQTQPEVASQIDDIIVTAQRHAEPLQSVPIAVSAFSAEALESQQIKNASDLQLSLPNVTFTKTNFAGSSFTIRGVGDLCVDTSCDQATAIHINDMPLLNSRVFETEYFDMERVEVLRGPQGTLFGRNATAGVVNFITARPDLDAFEANAQAEIGNYDSRKFTGMINVPLGDKVGVRLSGTHLNRDGYTENLYDGSRIDGRDLYALRGTVRFQPTASTTFDVIGSYFHEDDDRSRFQKQLCGRDETAILGCRPDRLGYETPNSLATFGALLSSREALRIASGGNALVSSMGLYSIYGPDAAYGGVANPADLRQVATDYTPRYEAENCFVMGRLEQQLGDHLSLTVTGGYNNDSTDQRADFNLTVANSLATNVGLNTLAATAQAPGAAFPGGINPFAPVFRALAPNGIAGGVCTSEPNRDYTGVYGGYVSGCSTNGAEFDASRVTSRQYSLEAHIDSDFDGPFNFLLGAIYLDNKVSSDYFVNAFTIDYAAGVLGAATTLGQRAAGNTAFPNVFLAPPYYNGEVTDLRLKSYGLFGELYYEPTETLKFTAGLRYSNDEKTQTGRNLTASFAVPFGVTDANQSPFIAGYDADSTQVGNQAYDVASVKSDALTGRLIAEWHPSSRNLVYASYSRGYKSAGINPPVPAVFQVQRGFSPESINAFEVGSKNTLLDGTLRLNGSLFYYDYSDLQVSRLVARSAVNDNTDAKIYGAELETIWSPVRNLRFNASASYLKTEIQDLAIVDPRDPSGGRSDVVIIKDVTTGANCAVIPNTVGNAAGSNGFVAAFNSALGLRAPAALPGTNTTGAFSLCDTLAATAANPSAGLRALFATPTGALPFTVATGVPVDVSGNRLPQSPEYKFSAGAEYIFELSGGLTLVPRIDYNYTGNFYSRVFNSPVDRIDGYDIVNAQVQLNGPDDRWYVRAFVQNLTDNDAITGQFLSDQSAGLFTNVFVQEPRRYGITASARF